MRTAPHPKARADRAAARTVDREAAHHEAAHREVPEELADAFRAAGFTSWTVRRWRSPLPACEDHARLLAEPERLPAGVARRAHTAELPDVVHDHSRGGADAGLPAARELP